MSDDVLKHDSPGVALLQRAIKELEVKVTKETTVEELHIIHNRITAYITEKLLAEIQKR